MEALSPSHDKDDSHSSNINFPPEKTSVEGREFSSANLPTALDALKEMAAMQYKKEYNPRHPSAALVSDDPNRQNNGELF